MYIAFSVALKNIINTNLLILFFLTQYQQNTTRDLSSQILSNSWHQQQQELTMQTSEAKC